MTKSQAAERSQLIGRLASLLFIVLTIFTLVGVVSYFFTWIPDAVGSGSLANSGAKLGYLWADFLVGKLAGVAALAMVIELGATALYFFIQKNRFSIWKFTVLCFTGMFVCSLILAQISNLIPPVSGVFGYGLGGMAAHECVSTVNSLVGVIVSSCIIFFLAIVWLVCVSSRFAHWFASFTLAPRVREAKQPEPAFDIDMPEEPVSEPQPAEEEQEDDFAEQIAAEMPEDAVEEPAQTEEPVAETENPAAETEEADAEQLSDMTPVTLDNGGEVTENEVVYEELPWINSRDELPKYKFPSLDILEDHSSSSQGSISREEVELNIKNIKDAFASFGIQIAGIQATIGPTITLYTLQLGPGVKVAQIKQRSEDIAYALKASVRVVVLQGAIGIEVPNAHPTAVSMKSVLNSEEFRNSKAELPVAIGYTVQRKVKVFDLADAPHLLVAGATKQGKSVGLNVLIASLLYSKHPSELKLVFIDPKMVEFNIYNRLLKHYLAVLPTAESEEKEKEMAIVKKPADAEAILASLCVEMDARFELISKSNVPNVQQYNKKFCERKLLPTEGHRFMPYMVVVVDEFADLVMSSGSSIEGRKSAKAINDAIIRLAQKGRAAGIHVIIATQRPSVQVVTPLIKANFPTRIAFRTVQMQDSMTILGQPGAEKLIGKGDMLYYAGVETDRVQCAFISSDEMDSVTKFIEGQHKFHECYNTPYYLPMPPSADGEGPVDVDMGKIDEYFKDAANLVFSMQMASTSNLQRKLGVGYARAGKIMDQLEAAGIVGAQDGSRPRTVLVATEEQLAQIFDQYGL